MSLRFLVYASDPARRDALRELLAEAGHELVDSLEAADVVLVPARDAGFAAMREHDLQVLLTPREMEVLSAIADGLGNKMIARRLNISLHTVKFHIESLFRKLGARTRAEAVAKGLERHAGETVEL
jgi:DNA-binding CsgD family transcriptional regulator